MLELALAAAFFTVLAIVTVLRSRRVRPASAEVRPMKAALERRMREGVEFTL